METNRAHRPLNHFCSKEEARGENISNRIRSLREKNCPQEQLNAPAGGPAMLFSSSLLLLLLLLRLNLLVLRTTLLVGLVVAYVSIPPPGGRPGRKAVFRRLLPLGGKDQELTGRQANHRQCRCCDGSLGRI